MVLRDPADGRQDDVIQASNIRGLNTIASSLTGEYGSSPDTLNTMFTPGGSVLKRPGTLTAAETTDGGYQDATETYGCHIGSSLGYNYTVVAGGWSGLGLDIYRLQTDDEAVLAMSKENVFSSRVYDVPLQFTTLSRRRTLITSGVNVPIELRLYETRFTNDGGSLNGEDYTVDESWGTLDEDDMEVFIDGVLVDKSLYSVTGDVIAFAASGLPDGTNVDVIRFVWGWWAESLVYWGNRFTNTAPRFNAYPSDRHVPIPETLLDDLEAIKPGYYPIFAEATNDSGGFTYHWKGDTTAFADEATYIFSDGSAGTPDTILQQQGATHLTFENVFTSTHSAYIAADGGVLVSFGRYRHLPFNGDTHIDWRNLIVYLKQRGTFAKHYEDTLVDNDVVWQDYYRIPNEFGTDLVWGSNELPTEYDCNWIAFNFRDAAKDIFRRVPSDTQVVLIHANAPADYVGSAATDGVYSEYPAGDGFMIPAYGISGYANYRTGIFPYCSAMFGNRLVLAGFANDPMRVVISAPSDSYVPGEEFTYFQADALNNPATAPTDFIVGASVAQEFIRGITQWQGSLFVFTTNEVWRLQTAESGWSVQRASSFGLVDSDSWATGDGRLFFASSDGVFEMVQSGGLADTYVPEEISLPIRNLFDKQVHIENMVFDEKTNRLYCVSGNKVYVYFAETNSWSVWRFAAQPNIYGCFISKDSSSEDRVVFVVTDAMNTDYAVMILGDSYDATKGVYRYQDYWGGSTFITVPSYTDVSYVVSNRAGFVEHGLETNPLLDYEDLTVYINSVISAPLTFGTQWTKLTPNLIHIDPSLLDDGDDIYVFKRNPETGGSNSWTTYQSWWKSVKFVRGELARYKRNTYLNLYMSLKPNGGVETSGGDVGEQFKAQPRAYVGFLFDDARYGDHSEQIYSALDLTYETGEYDWGESVYNREAILLREYIQGVGIDFQFIIFDEGGCWQMDAFQIEGTLKGRRHVQR